MEYFNIKRAGDFVLAREMNSETDGFFLRQSVVTSLSVEPDGNGGGFVDARLTDGGPVDEKPVDFIIGYYSDFQRAYKALIAYIKAEEEPDEPPQAPAPPARGSKEEADMCYQRILAATRGKK